MDHKVEFGNFDESVLAKSWKWLNDPELKHLTNTPDFDLIEQKKWFEQLKVRDDYYIKSIIFDNETIGVCGIKNLTNLTGEVWLYIGEKNLWGRKIGEKSLTHLIEYAYSKSLKSLYARILKENERSLRLFYKNNFKLNSDLGNLVQVKLYL